MQIVDLTGTIISSGGSPVMNGNDIFNALHQFVDAGKAGSPSFIAELIMSGNLIFLFAEDPVAFPGERVTWVFVVNDMNAQCMIFQGDTTAGSSGGGGGGGTPSPSPPPPPPPSTLVTIRGRIVDMASRPLSGQKITVQFPSGYTYSAPNGVDGVFSLIHDPEVIGTAVVTDENFKVSISISVPSAPGTYDVGDLIMPFMIPSITIGTPGRIPYTAPS
jgi:hypothetical protein